MNPHAFTEDLCEKLANGKTLDDALKELRSSGASKIQCIIALDACRKCGIGEAKRLVHFSPAWADVREQDEQFHQDLEQRMTDEYL